MAAAWRRGGVVVRIPNERQRRRQRLVTLSSAQGQKVGTAIIPNHLDMHWALPHLHNTRLCISLNDGRRSASRAESLFAHQAGDDKESGGW